jgi:hypothetical protein
MRETLIEAQLLDPREFDLHADGISIVVVKILVVTPLLRLILEHTTDAKMLSLSCQQLAVHVLTAHSPPQPIPEVLVKREGEIGCNEEGNHLDCGEFAQAQYAVSISIA